MAIKIIITFKAIFDEEQVKRVKIIASKCNVLSLMAGSTLIQDEVNLI
ncbi:MAG TPA: hypothetical protein VJ991_06545 [Balneolales bacterium]|nr:hypothetical protein [Balneolales bacterium]